MILKAARQAFVLTVLDAFFIYFLTSMYTDLHISEVDISAIAVNASAITWVFPYELFKSFYILYVTIIRISVDSSISYDKPKYPILFSVKLVELTHFMHSNCPKWVGYPNRLKNKSFAIFLFLCLFSSSLFDYKYI